MEPRVVAVYVHVDGFGALSDDARVSDEAIDVIAAELNRIGFQVKVLHCHEVKRYIGLCLGGGGSQWLPMPDKLALIVAAIEELTLSRTVWPHEVRSVVAH